MSLCELFRVGSAACFFVIFAFWVQPVRASNVQYSGLQIAKVRAVGDYQGVAFDNTLEVWPVTLLVAGANCTSLNRFYIDAKNKHLISIVYLALSMGRKIDVNLDDSLPIRDGACEASYVDLSSQ